MNTGGDIQRRECAFKDDGFRARTQHRQREGVDRGNGFCLVLGNEQDAGGQRGRCTHDGDETGDLHSVERGV
jgi:hypothetical protein